ESDLQQLTEIARQMVGRWGMSGAIGHVSVVTSPARGPNIPGASEVSPHTQQLDDDEVHRIVEAGYADVLTVLRENRSQLDSLAAALLEHETLDQAEAYAAAGLEQPRDPAGAFALAARSVSVPARD
ncbi:MAG: cell division protease FtsH, partial [Gaiellaceae bacterium]|nr:cell division protease FtsH [Gaiellaceae bacterium]